MPLGKQGSAQYVLAKKLLSASAKGKLDQVIELLQQGANVAINKHGRTPLHISCHRGFLDIVRLLLQSGCNPDLQDDNGDTALHRAVTAGHERVVERLLDEACNVNIQNNLGDTALHEAARCGHNNCVKKLIKSNANVLCKNNNGDLPLHMACANGHRRAVEILLCTDSPVSCGNEQKDSPLHLAVRFGHYSSASLLISAKCDINSQNHFGNTPLHIATATRQRHLVRLLLNCKAEAQKIKNKDGKSSVDVARDLESGELLLMLISGARPFNRKRQTRSISHNFPSRERSYSEIAARRKSWSEECAPRASLCRSTARVKLRKKPSLRKRYHSPPQQTLQEHQKNVVVNPYVVPQLYSLYRDSSGDIQQRAIIDRLPNPTPEVVANLQQSIEDAKLEWSRSLVEITSSMNEKLEELRRTTEHRLKALDRITEQRIGAERSLCLQRIEQRTSCEQSLSESKVVEQLKQWVESRMERFPSSPSDHHKPLSSTSTHCCHSHECECTSVDSGVGSTPTCPGIRAAYSSQKQCEKLVTCKLPLHPTCKLPPHPTSKHPPHLTEHSQLYPVCNQPQCHSTSCDCESITPILRRSLVTCSSHHSSSCNHQLSCHYDEAAYVDQSASSRSCGDELLVHHLQNLHIETTHAV